MTVHEASKPMVEPNENASTAENGHSIVVAPNAAQAAASSLAAIIPEEILPLCNDRPLLSTEDDEGQLGLIRFLVSGIGPGDPIGWMLVLDLADFDLEIRRLRKLKAGVIELARTKQAERLTTMETYDLDKDPLAKSFRAFGEVAGIPWEPKRQIAKGANGGRASLKQTNDPADQMPKSKLETEIDTARAFLDCIGNYERIDKLLEAAESRRSDMLRELRIHGESLSRTRERKNEVIDAQYSETPAPS